MKPIIAVLAAAIAGLAFGAIPADAAASKRVQIATAGKADEVSSHRRRHRPVPVYSQRYVDVQEQPVPLACDAVVFPRNPLCGYQSKPPLYPPLWGGCLPFSCF
jgi:hypothetical protein